jgi:hypothetical protein
MRAHQGSVKTGRESRPPAGRVDGVLAQVYRVTFGRSGHAPVKVFDGAETANTRESPICRRCSGTMLSSLLSSYRGLGAGHLLGHGSSFRFANRTDLASDAEAANEPSLNESQKTHSRKEHFIAFEVTDSVHWHLWTVVTSRDTAAEPDWHSRTEDPA